MLQTCRRTHSRMTVRLPLLPSMKEHFHLDHEIAAPKCADAWECILQEPSFRPISNSTDPAAPAGDGIGGNPYRRKRSHSNETGHLRITLERKNVLARPFLTTPCHGGELIIEPCEQSVPIREVSCLDHGANVDVQGHKRNPRRESGKLNLPYTDVSSVTTDAPSARKGSVFDDLDFHPHCDQIRARKRRQFSNRTRTECGTCRRRKKKCDEAKPKCNNCLQGKIKCAGYRKPIQQSDDNGVQAHSARQLHQRISLTEVPAHIVRCLVCNITHNPLCKPSQKIYAEHAVPTRTTTSQTKPVRADRPGPQMP